MPPPAKSRCSARRRPKVQGDQMPLMHSASGAPFSWAIGLQSLRSRICCLWSTPTDGGILRAYINAAFIAQASCRGTAQPTYLRSRGVPARGTAVRTTRDPLGHVEGCALVVIAMHLHNVSHTEFPVGLHAERVVVGEDRGVGTDGARVGPFRGVLARRRQREDPPDATSCVGR
eukprot:scaffold2473_cov247-Pinguiococcus_pyrenoidosus.AAC.4